jgi:hypothetical protein
MIVLYVVYMFMYGIRMGSYEISASIVTTPWVGQPSNLDLIFGRRKRFFSPSHSMSRLLLFHTISYPAGIRQKKNGPGVKPTAHLYLTLRLRMHGAIPPLPHIGAGNFSSFSLRFLL